MLGESLNYDQVDRNPDVVVVWRPRSSGPWQDYGPTADMDIDPAVAFGGLGWRNKVGPFPREGCQYLRTEGRHSLGKRDVRLPLFGPPP